MAAEFERVLVVKNEVFVYRIPARTSNRGYRAAEWKLDTPDWTGRLRIISLGKDLFLKLEDKCSGELFASCPVDKYPGVAVEQVLDSSRYFVLRIQDPSGRAAFIGIGFADRSDSFDLLVTIQDHFKHVSREEKEAAEEEATFEPGPKLDLGFKEGQTIRINIGAMKEGTAKSRPKTSGNMGGSAGLLPPPPGGVKLAGPPRSPSNNRAVPAPPSAGAQRTVPDLFPAPVPAPAPQPAAPAAAAAKNDLDFLLDLGPSSGPQPGAAPAASADPWGDFTSASSNNSSSQGSTSSDPWVQF